MTINWTIMIPSSLVILGWFIANGLTARRELLNKKREIRVGYMIEAYRRISSAANRWEESTSEARKRDVESAVQDIQLLGNAEQMAELKKVLDGGNDFTSTLEALRRELREELDLSPASGPLKIYRLE